MITTTAILTEIADGLSKIPYRAAAIRLISALEQDVNVDVVVVDEDPVARGLELYRSRMD